MLDCLALFIVTVNLLILAVIDPWKDPDGEKHSPRDFLPYGTHRRVNPPPAVATLSMRRDDSELPPAPTAHLPRSPNNRTTTPPTSPLRQEGHENWAPFSEVSPDNRQEPDTMTGQDEEEEVRDDQDFSLDFSHACGYQAATSVEPVDPSARKKLCAAHVTMQPYCICF